LLTACACMICFAPVIATYIPLSMVQFLNSRINA
jgi:hypothetical protein